MNRYKSIADWFFWFFFFLCVLGFIMAITVTVQA